MGLSDTPEQSEQPERRGGPMTPDEVEAVLRTYCDGKSLTQSLAAIGRARWQWLKAVNADPELRQRYEAAHEINADAMFDNLDAPVRAAAAGKIPCDVAKLQVDTNKWRLKVKHYQRFAVEERRAVDVTTAGQPIITTFRVGRERVERIAGGRVDEPDGEPADGG